MESSRREAWRGANRLGKRLLGVLLAVMWQPDSARRLQDCAPAAQAIACDQSALLTNGEGLQGLFPFAPCDLQIEQGIERPVCIRFQA